MLDTSSDVTLVKEAAYSRCKESFGRRGPGTTLLGLGRKPQKSLGSVPLHLKINDGYVNLVGQIVPDTWLSYDLLLGRDILQENFELKINSDGIVISSKEKYNEKEDDGNFVSHMDVLSLTVEEKLPCLEDITNKSLQRTIEHLIKNYTPQKPEKSCIEMNIMLEDETPVFQKPRRLAPKEKEIVNDQVTQWLKDGIIQNSFSDFASPVVLTKRELDELEKRVQDLTNMRQVDMMNLQNAERRLVEERRQRQSLEAQLNNEKKARKIAEDKATRPECSDACKQRKQQIEAEAKQLRRELKVVEEAKQAAEQQGRKCEQELRMFEAEVRNREAQQGTEVLMSALAAMQDKNITLEKSLSAERRVKLDLFSALGEAKCEVEIKDSLLRSKDEEVLDLKAKIAQLLAVMPTDTLCLPPCSTTGSSMLRMNDTPPLQGPSSPMSTEKMSLNILKSSEYIPGWDAKTYSEDDDGSDFMIIEDELEGAKLHPMYAGPYEVVKIKGKDRYDLRKVGNHEGPNTTSSAADLMKPWYDGKDTNSESSEADD